MNTRELAVLGIVSVVCLSLVIIGVLSLRGAVADVTGIVSNLPSISDQGDARCRGTSRETVSKDYRYLLILRCAPGAFVVAIGTGWLSYAFAWAMTP